MKDEPQVKAALLELLAELQEHSIVKDFQAIEEKTRNNQTLEKMEEQIKALQKEAVSFAHYGKPEAERQALAQADALRRAYEEHPLVVSYRQRLQEANDLLHYVTGRIQTEINEPKE